jgi:hypothetical protein
MCKNLDSPHPLTPSPKDGRRGTRIMSPLSFLGYGVYTSDPITQKSSETSPCPDGHPSPY